ncbi:TIGR01244 family sulfur transferase, partial [Neisseria chenwenguii]
MTILKLAENLYIAPQLTAADAAQAAALGVQAVICNRPDGEEPDQPAAAEVKQWLADAGIGQFAHQPVTA